MTNLFACCKDVSAVVLKLSWFFLQIILYSELYVSTLLCSMHLQISCPYVTLARILTYTMDTDVLRGVYNLGRG